MDPDRPEPAEIELEDWLFDTTAGPERREAEARFVHGHLLKPGDVARTDWSVRCAQPPYDRLPLPRVEIPPGVILSRDGTEWIWEGAGIEDMALPLYEGRMIGQFDFSQKGWVSGKGRGAVWRDIPWERKQIEPQYLMRLDDYHERIESPWRPKVTHMSVGSATNRRTAIGTFVCGVPGSHKAPMLYTLGVDRALAVTIIYNSFVYDYLMRARVVGLGIDYHVLEQTPLPPFHELLSPLAESSRMAESLCLTAQQLAPVTLELRDRVNKSPSEVVLSAFTVVERTRFRAILDALVAVLFDLNYSDLQRILEDCDLPSEEVERGRLNPKGFWRIDKDRDPELRHTVLTLVAFHNLESKIHEASGNRDKGIRAFFAQNNGEGWLLPQNLRLADYGLGHDERACSHQPVASRLGPRFYDWQLAQSADESWRECHLHARNLLGRLAYAELIESLIHDRGQMGAEHHDLLVGEFTRSLVRRDNRWSHLETDQYERPDSTAKRAPEPDASYTAAPSARVPQMDIFPRTQPDLFE